MSWDRFEYSKIASCACGQGNVIKRCYQEDDDWNRSRSGVLGYSITCPSCREKYHIDSITRIYYCPLPWKGSGVVTEEYLVPNNMKLPKVITPTCLQTYKLDEDIASKFTREQLKFVIQDMQNSKFSTRVQLDDSKNIVVICEKRLKTKSIQRIVPFLQSIVDKYDDYEWNPNTIAEFRKEEQQRIDDNEKEIQRVIENSFELTFVIK